MLVGLLAILYWKRRAGSPFRVFMMGGAIWIVAIFPKLLMDLTITPGVSRWASLTLGATGNLVVLGLLVGFRTGFFEGGFTYLTFSRTRLRASTLNEATAFGVGFGGLEAILLGALGTVNFAVLLSNPELLSSLPAEQPALVMRQLSESAWIVFVPMLERVFTLLLHVFVALLMFGAVLQAKWRYFLAGFALKSMLDGILPYWSFIVQPTASLEAAYLAEAPVAALGILSLIGMRWVRRTLTVLPLPEQESSSVLH